MQTVCMIACVILGLFFGTFVGFGFAFKRMLIITDSVFSGFCDISKSIAEEKESEK